MVKLNDAAFSTDALRQVDKVAMWSFIRSQRGAPLLVYSNFIYRCERKISARTYWLCIRYKGHRCNARLIINGNSVCKETEHNHGADNRSNESQVELKNLQDDDVDEWLKGSPKHPPT
jgi:hypothetical protein